MASTSTMTSWLEELAQSLLPIKGLTKKKPPRRNVETFRRRVRNHTFVRTNQFDVEDRLSGLEEKFQVLARDDLSDTLHEYRVELKEHEQRWIPDVLDLLLRLSKNPVGANSILDIHDLEPYSPTSPPSHWADIASEDPLDLDGQLWKKPVFSDLSSDEGSVKSLSESASLASIEEVSKSCFVDIQNYSFDPFEPSTRDDENEFPMVSPRNLSGKVTEIELIRECLFMLHGYPTVLFMETNGHLQLRSDVYLQEVNNSVVQTLLSRVLVIRKDIDIVRKWLQENSSVMFMQVIQRELSEIVTLYISWINSHIDLLLHPRSTATASILQTVSEAEDRARVLSSASNLVQTFRKAEPVKCLDLLYEAACQHILFEAEPVVHGVIRIFVRALHAYITPLRTWLHEGKLESDSYLFFIQETSSKADASNLWRGWYSPAEIVAAQAPLFLSTYVNDILACGKTSAFLRLVAQNSASDVFDTVATEFDDLMKDIHSAANNSSDYFPAAFDYLLNNYFQTLLSSKTASLKRALDSQCGLNSSLEAIEHLYLRRNGVIMDNIESKIFPRIDYCINTWNDRFLVADMLEEHFLLHTSVDVGAIMVHSAHTSSRSMESRRRSVRILAALAIEYRLPWPVANIIPKEAMASYRQVALILTQIRRAKHILERIAYTHLQQQPISESSSDQKYAQLTVFTFLQFVNITYDHFTTNIIAPLTNQMRRDLEIAPTIDQMRASHAAYMTKLEFACLTARQVSILKDILIGLLDMCIRLADLVRSPSNTQRRGSDDVEASSFISAQSTRRRRRRNAARADEHGDSDDDDDDSVEGEEEDNIEGYSTFVVLEEDTTVIKEIRKLEVRFRKQLDLFVAGLRGAGRSGEMMDEFEILAGRLEWKKTSMR